MNRVVRVKHCLPMAFRKGHPDLRFSLRQFHLERCLSCAVQRLTSASRPPSQVFSCPTCLGRVGCKACWTAPVKTTDSPLYRMPGHADTEATRSVPSIKNTVAVYIPTLPGRVFRASLPSKNAIASAPK
jgi:hypothetical protein